MEDFLTTQRGRQIARQASAASMRRSGELKAAGAGNHRKVSAKRTLPRPRRSSLAELRSRTGFAPSFQHITLQRAGLFPRTGRVYASERLFGLRFRRHSRVLREPPPRFQRPSKTRPLSVMVTATELLTGFQRTCSAAGSFFFRATERASSANAPLRSVAGNLDIRRNPEIKGADGRGSGAALKSDGSRPIMGTLIFRGAVPLPARLGGNSEA